MNKLLSHHSCFKRATNSNNQSFNLFLEKSYIKYIKLGLYGNDPCLVHLNIPALEVTRVSYYEAESER